MKKITLFAILFSAVAFTSCSKDNPASTNTYGTSTGDYFPMTVGNQWLLGADPTSALPSNITGTDVFGGTTYYQITNLLSGSGVGSLVGNDTKQWVTKRGGTYFAKVGDVNTTAMGMTITMAGFELPILRDDFAVGGTWAGTIPLNVAVSMGSTPLPLKMTLDYTGTILEKNATATVNGVEYHDVIKTSIKEIITSPDPSTGQTTTQETDTEDWFAKGIGPIKEIQTSQGKTTEVDLINYTLK